MTQKLCAMMSVYNYGVTAPLWERQNAGCCQEHASTALSASACKILTFLQDEDAYRRFYCGSLSWLQDPYKLWRMLQVIKKITKFTATRMDPVACSNYHNQPSVYIFVLQKGQNLACVR